MINYRIVGRQKPGTQEPENLKYYAQVVSPGMIDMEGLAKRISGKCTVTRADCLAVLAALQEEVIYALQSGMRVHLGDVGAFRMSCQCMGVPTPEEVEVKNIKKLKVIFCPNVVLKNAIDLKNKEVSFYNLEKGAAGKTDEDGEDGMV